MSISKTVFKIRDGTVNCSENICESCLHGKKVRGHWSLRKIVCTAGLFTQTKGLVTEPIAECSSYFNSSVPNADEYLPNAWVLYKTDSGEHKWLPFGSMPEEDKMKVKIGFRGY